LVKRGRTSFAAGGKGKVIFYTHRHTQPIGDSLEKIILSLRKNEDFHLLNFENAHFCVKEEEKSKIFTC